MTDLKTRLHDILPKGASIGCDWFVESAQNATLTATDGREFIDFAGGIGFIAPYSKDFCTTCNRLRITSQGKMHLCLFGGVSYDLRDFLRRGDREGLTEFLHETMRLKPEHHYLHNKKVGLITNLSMTGG